METYKLTSFIILFLFGLNEKFSIATRINSHKSCNFSAVYNFGDSNSDTGAISAAIGEVPPPNGVAFFGRSEGRHSDGRLIIDFISKYQSFSIIHSLLFLNSRSYVYPLIKLH